MWKKTVLSSATFIGGYYISLSRHLPVALSENSDHDASSSRNEDFHSYIYLPENAENGIYEFSESSSFSGMSSKTHAYWNLLMLSKSKDKIIRHKAIDSLSKLSEIHKWQCVMVAQASDACTSVGLARMPHVNLSFFLPSPLRNLKGGDLHSELHMFLLSLPVSDTDQHIQKLMTQAVASSKRVFKNRSDCDFEDSFSIFHSEQKKKAVFEFHKLSLLTILGISAINSHRNFLIQKGILNLLFKVWKAHESDIEFQSLIAQILANIALEEGVISQFFLTGWIGILARWVKSPAIEVNLPAVKALANLDRDDLNYAQYDDGVYLLTPVFRESKKLFADIILLHGLRGATFWTWRQNDCEKHNKLLDDLPKDHMTQNYTQCWPKDWLAVDFPNIRMLSLDYKTSVSNWRKSFPQNAEKESLKNKAKDLTRKLLSSSVGERPIVWIAHSMGGLLVKHILIEAAESDDSKLKLLLKNTIGIIFYSVPHKGSELATIMHSASRLFQPSFDIVQLQKGCPPLLSLHEKFKDIILTHNIAVLSFGETKKTRWGFDFSVLVPVDSSDPGFGEFYPLPEDHLSVCKPATRNSVIYSKVLEFLTNVLTEQQDQVSHSFQDKIWNALKSMTFIP